ncbi:hypothetical protein [Rhodospirillum sp. A1_3_36]
MSNDTEEGELVFTKTIRRNGKVYVHPTGYYVFRAKPKSPKETKE